MAFTSAQDQKKTYADAVEKYKQEMSMTEDEVSKEKELRKVSRVSAARYGPPR